MRKSTKGIVLEFEGLGPLRRGKINIKPLTIFIGPNASGKSYASMLVYALYKALYTHFFDLVPSLLALIDEAGSSGSTDEDYYYRKIYESAKSSFEKRIKENIVALFMDLNSLVNVNSNRLIVNIRFKNRIKYGFTLVRGKDLTVNYTDFENFLSIIKKTGIDNIVSYILSSSRSPNREKTYRFRFMLARTLTIAERLISLTREIFVPSEIYYLPAARSGLLQAYRLIASTMVALAPRFPLMSRQEISDIATLTGISADFIRTLLQLRSLGEGKELSRATEFLERNILRGTIEVIEKKGVAVEIMYRDLHSDLLIPVISAASGIAELAPLDLYLKYVVRPGTMLIFEEPEAHLHPRMQRNIARLIAMLVNSGVWVLITTHSDLILEEFNILMRLSRMSEEERKKLGYEGYEYLNTNSVSAYLYKYDDNEKGYVAKELSITEDEGIPQDELTEVAFEMGETHAKITRMAELGERAV